MPASIKELLADDQFVFTIGMGRVCHHNLIQMIGVHGGFEALWFDMEHGNLSMEDLEVATLACRSQGMDSFVRVAPTDYATVTRCLEAGGGGVMAAQIHTAEQAEEFVKWTKFAPRGNRGLNSSGWDGQYGTIGLKEFCEKANRESFLAIQIETEGSVEECNEIAAIDGVDLLFVGPADLSQNLGVTGDFFNEKCIEAIDKVAAACSEHGKYWGAVSVNPEHAQMLVEKGCRMISPASDTKLIMAGLGAIQSDYGVFFSEG